MRLIGVRVSEHNNTVRLSGRLEGYAEEPYFEFPKEFETLVAANADAFLPALLVPALERGESLEIVPPISARLAQRVPRLVDVLVSLFPAFRRAPITVHARPNSTEPRGTIVASLFSGGVDSFHTLLTTLAPASAPSLRPTHLFCIAGHEVRLGDASGFEETLRNVKQIGCATQIGVIYGRTNLRAIFDLNYELYYHGALLIACALALSRGMRRLLVSSTNSYGQLSPWGSHPVLDELWSTENLDVIHYGAETRRVDKIAVVADSPLALNYLRVCSQNAEGAGNCGRCKKCARTIMALDLVGKLDEAPSFPRMSRGTLAHGLRSDYPEYLQELCDFARELNAGEKLAFLESIKRSKQRRQALRLLAESTPAFKSIVPIVEQLRGRFRGTPA